MACARAGGRPARPGYRAPPPRRRGRAHRARAARAALEESLGLCRAMGDPWQWSVALIGLAGVARPGGTGKEARRRYDGGAGDPAGDGRPAGHRHRPAQPGGPGGAGGRRSSAAARFREGLALFRAVGDRHGLAWCLAGLAPTAALGRPAREARMLGTAAPPHPGRVQTCTPPSARPSAHRGHGAPGAGRAGPRGGLGGGRGALARAGRRDLALSPGGGPRRAGRDGGDGGYAARAGGGGPGRAGALSNRQVATR